MPEADKEAGARRSRPSLQFQRPLPTQRGLVLVYPIIRGVGGEPVKVVRPVGRLHLDWLTSTPCPKNQQGQAPGSMGNLPKGRIKKINSDQPKAGKKGGEKPMRQILTVGVKARFPLSKINDLWSEFLRQLTENPCEDFFEVGDHTDFRSLRHQKILVKIDQYPGEKVATMLLSDEW